MPEEAIVTSPVKVWLTIGRERQLRAINRAVNTTVEYATDQKTRGVREYWEIAGRRGDCEDIALLKMHMLRALGWPKESLDIAICSVNGAGHAVLVAHTDEADLVLDNNTDAVLRWTACDVIWIETSVAGNFGDWRKIAA